MASAFTSGSCLLPQLATSGIAPAHDLTLYILAELPDVWAAPPVSLDIREDMQNIDNTLSGGQPVRSRQRRQRASLRIDALEKLEQDGGDYLLKAT